MLRPDPVPGSAVWKSSATPSRGLLGVTILVLVVSAATILGALGFEHIGGYQPCALCLMQRTPYYVGVPLSAAAALAAFVRAPRVLLVLLFGGFAALMLYGAGLAAYHAGVEWKFWPGPQTCTGTGHVDVGELKDLLAGKLHNIVRCDQPAWIFLGVAMAGWNAVGSLILAGLSAAAALRERAKA